MAFPHESIDKFEERIYDTMESVLWEAIGNNEIEMDLVCQEFDGWKSGLAFEHEEDGYIAYSYERSLVERDKFMQFFEKIAPDFLTLKDTSYGTTVLDENKDNVAAPVEHTVDYDKQCHVQAEQTKRRTTDNQYCFIKTDIGWDLKFEDVVLRDVKNLKGMKYINILLQNPNEKINVFKLQELAGGASMSGEENEDEPYDGGDQEDVSHDHEWYATGVLNLIFFRHLEFVYSSVFSFSSRPV